MGGGCSKCILNVEERGNIHNRGQNAYDDKKAIRKISNINQKSGTIINHYSIFQYKNESYMNGNMLVFTYEDGSKNEFIILDSEYNESVKSNIFKSNGLALGYSKGYKIDSDMQDKFFVVLDGDIQVYCVIDGHGPYGNIVAQIIQDKIFKEITDVIYRPEFEMNYIEILEKIFSNTQSHLLKLDEREDLDYDCYLSGGVITLIVLKDDYIYCANVGNISASLFFSEKVYSFKFKIIELTTDHTAMKFQKFNFFYGGSNTNLGQNSPEGKVAISEKEGMDHNFMKISIHNNDYIYKNFDKLDETRRIYESGGEIRELAGEDQSRIFVKGKYYPAIISTRSIGDEIASQIGVKSEPHISAYKLDKRIDYHLLICSDGISNALKIEDIVGIIENNDILFLESINQILQQAKNEYPKHSYTPDMTILLKKLKNFS